MRGLLWQRERRAEENRAFDRLRGGAASATYSTKSEILSETSKGVGFGGKRKGGKRDDPEKTAAPILLIIRNFFKGMKKEREEGGARVEKRKAKKVLSSQNQHAALVGRRKKKKKYGTVWKRTLDSEKREDGAYKGKDCVLCRSMETPSTGGGKRKITTKVGEGKGAEKASISFQKDSTRLTLKDCRDSQGRTAAISKISRGPSFPRGKI